MHKPKPKAKLFTILFAAAIALAAMISCNKSSSESHSTREIDADMTVIARDNQESEVIVELTDDSGPFTTHIILTGDDRLDATADGRTERLDRDGDQYEATFDTAEGGTEFRIALKRDVDKDARNSTVILPGPFDIEAPLNNALVTGDAPLTISWTPDDDADRMWMQAWGDCRASGSETVRLTGPRFNLNDAAGTTAETVAELLGVNDLGSYDQGCACTIRIRRENDGHLDHRFDEGEIVAEQRREVDFRYQP